MFEGPIVGLYKKKIEFTVLDLVLVFSSEKNPRP